MQPLGVDVLHLNIGFTATPAMERLGMPIEFAETPDAVAREGLENITNGPLHIVSTPGNEDQVRRVGGPLDDRGALVKDNAIPPREETAQAAQQQAENAGKVG